MARSSLLAPLGLLFLAGSQLLLWFVILSGVTRSPPLRQTYFLRADTSGIEGARAVSQWTYFQVCGLDNTDCGGSHPALPLGFAWAPHAAGAPPDLIGKYGGDTTSHYYWYMWRFGWVFFLLALFFEVLAFFGGLFALCSRLVSGFAGLLSLVALFFFTIAVSMMTATFVKMRNVFTGEGRAANVGSYAFGFSWGSWAALLIATALFFAASRKRTSSADPVVPAANPGKKRGLWPFGKGKGTKAADGRRVKEDYA
ncbi:SUR7/PalI family-domain-containing protein [Staphylotrichum tortipilum]|uniref:SUR7/PalI family-domain-containing protein n=1 Tax=Staphylotrichum tortipilum TaxID=2831512 RepID=A0AAN6RVJ7_9PEZI|nr:SUR7/PalI family-domain-containing protein [Staphylotrichum longicolle]